MVRVCETIGKVKPKLSSKIALIGFCGAPWTVATYIVGGGGSDEREFARNIAHEYPSWFAKLMNLIVEASTEYLVAQIDAGAEAVQIFDSWAGDPLQRSR
jgi:uroporphyrinogen decarboxylase